MDNLIIILLIILAVSVLLNITVRMITTRRHQDRHEAYRAKIDSALDKQ